MVEFSVRMSLRIPFPSPTGEFECSHEASHRSDTMHVMVSMWKYECNQQLMSHLDLNAGSKNGIGIKKRSG